MSRTSVKRKDRLVSLVYLVCLVCLLEPDRPDRPDEPSLVPPVSHVLGGGRGQTFLTLAHDIKGCDAIGFSQRREVEDVLNK